jgi:hypothetical protein
MWTSTNKFGFLYEKICTVLECDFTVQRGACYPCVMTKRVSFWCKNFDLMDFSC